MTLTAAQQKAIAARGNVLVVAGAGTGKTRTLVERCVACLLSDQPRASIDEILMVTFTEAAAAEMRQRIRQRTVARQLRRAAVLDRRYRGPGSRRARTQSADHRIGPHPRRTWRLGRRRRRRRLQLR